MARNPDVVVAGGGIIGCATAYLLAREGLSVTLVEKGQIGREASWAAGGILTPVHLADYPGPLADLCAASMRLYEPLVRQIAPLSSADPELRTTGLLILAIDDAGLEAARRLEAWRLQRGQPAERLSREEATRRQPGLPTGLREALYLPDIAQIRNHRMTRALAQAAMRLGAAIRTGIPATGFLRVPGRVTGVKTPRGDIYAGTTVFTAGAWSSECLQPLGLELPVKPIKGQMLLLEAAPDFLRHMILEGDSYLVPRADGRILVGSTIEDAGFDKTVTLEAVGRLAAQAVRMIPAAARLPMIGSWAGLRPATPDRLPYLGRAPVEGLILATGHYRNGILLAPITAQIVVDLILGRPPSVPLDPFRPMRG